VRSERLDRLVLHIRNGLSVRQSREEDGLPITRIETISEGVIDPARLGYAGLAENDCKNWLLQPGDILFSHINSTAHLGKVAIYEGIPRKLIHGMNLLCIRPDTHRVNPKYLLYALRSHGFRRQLARTIKPAVNQASIAISDLKQLELAIPTVAEQRRIAEILDKADALRAKRRAALAQLDTLTQSIFLDMFGDPATNQKNWTKVTLGEVANFVGGGTPSRDKPEFFTGSICWATSKDMQSDFLDDTQEHITEAAVANSATKLVPAGTILIVVKSKVLAKRLPVAISRVATCFGQDLKGVQIGPRCEVSFVAASLRLESRLLLKSARGINTEGLTLEHLRAFRLLLPPLELQREFARRIDAVLNLKAKVTASLRQLESVFASLQHRAFRGDL
jgi:type I restriction enzyme, S subunit